MKKNNQSFSTPLTRCFYFVKIRVIPYLYYIKWHDKLVVNDNQYQSIKEGVIMIHVANATLGTTYKIKSMLFDNAMVMHRLHALGFTEGSEIKVRQKSLFKGPCTLDINGQHVCIRNCDACKIMLEQVHE